MAKKLIPPVSYQGGKQRLSKKIVDIIFDQNAINNSTQFYDLCSGSGAISLELVNRGISSKNITMVDSGVYGTFWKLISNKQFAMNDFMHEVLKIPNNKDDIKSYMEKMINSSVVNENDIVYKFLLLQASSFGSKQISFNYETNTWNGASFRNYWKPTPTSNRRSPVNPMQPMPKTIIKRIEQILNADLSFRVFNQDIYTILSDFKKHKPNTVIYIDPPYKNTVGYKNGFDWEDFLLQLLNRTSAPIYVSECHQYSKNAILLNMNNRKGGISGKKRRGKKQEWLNIYNSAL